MSDALTSAVPVNPTTTVLHPIDIRKMRLASTGFWGSRAVTNASATIDHCASWLERSGWLGNFDLAREGDLVMNRRGREFSDSEVYKLLEGVAWQLAIDPSPERARLFSDWTERIAAAQEEDGYLGTRFGRPGQGARYSDLEWGHELYNAGHLLQTAVARLRTHEEDALTLMARRVADHICDVFGEGAREAVCGHPEVELGLVEFARATGERRYLEQARVFIDRRGRGLLDDIEFGRSYFQDDEPIREATVLRGHAVRALYLSAAAVDVAIDTGDLELLAAIERQWERTVASRTYITGGMGSHHQDEAFGEDFELPNDRAYCETCAGIASVMLSWRLLLATGAPRYADLIERTLFNVVATASADDGRSFFYSNTLHRRTPGSATDPDEQSKRADSSQRASWFDVACCPNNLARTLASLGGYLATSTFDGVQIHQYASSSLSSEVLGSTVRLRVDTEYPAVGLVTITIDESPDAPWTLSLRIPEWADKAHVRVQDDLIAVSPGIATITRAFSSGDVIELLIPMEVRVAHPDRRIDSSRGTVAFERGPLVYCLESVDLPHDVSIDDIVVDPATAEGSADGIRVQAVNDGERPPQGWPFGPATDPTTSEPFSVSLIPYNRWGNRGPATMRIWIRTI
jgi:DUF1680 family protein